MAGKHSSTSRTDVQWDAMVLVGRIARPHGLRGQVVVNPETDFVEERFRPGARLWTRTGEHESALTITSARVQNGRPVVAFEGMSRREDVEPLAGMELRVPEEALQPLEPGRFYEHQLVGCSVETVDGVVLGSVVRVEGGAGGSRLAVEGSAGEILIPLAVDICVDIDVEARRIRIEPPAGLVDLNETRRSRRAGRG
jgi:16S rRNA processing protein RimM